MRDQLHWIRAVVVNAHDNHRAPSTGRARNIADEMAKKIQKKQTDRIVLNLADSPVDLNARKGHARMAISYDLEMATTSSLEQVARELLDIGRPLALFDASVSPEQVLRDGAVTPLRTWVRGYERKPVPWAPAGLRSLGPHHG